MPTVGNYLLVQPPIRIRVRRPNQWAICLTSVRSDCKLAKVRSAVYVAFSVTMLDVSTQINKHSNKQIKKSDTVLPEVN